MSHARNIFTTATPGYPQGPAAAKPAANPRTRANRIFGGARANRSGDRFESVVMLSLNVRGVRLLELEALPKSGARFHGRRQAHALPMPCDFIGTVIGRGTAIYFDAKSCGADEYGIALNNAAILKTHQAQFLRTQRAAGAVAGLLVESKRLEEYLWLDATHLGPMRAYTAWHDARWLHLGSTSSVIEFSRLIAAYFPATPRPVGEVTHESATKQETTAAPS